ncbi:aromatic ring-hydroxylating dioxygenase subunit alpha [Frigidibacter sp. RF13]|uniref:aromatic ring-hydroxylating oxygenase subunit alpha n=1 Tax=Frigidibacter sp. RF13 TaxID=2997340 RepID=UPI00226E1F2C|nr:aromatic ring-hydroxylating dioxygenase subunit alpha [Frigidibacter sp. RF13]MCY1128094.1 aromatic ring-hydroxylating dioxygenase subunit alpha [Frigidibacter sp. RF13]
MSELAPGTMAIPNGWDRRGLPGWTYHSQALFDLERTELFLTHWQVAGHVNDVPSPGDWISFDLLGERAVIMRGRDGVVRAFHNLCRHRGARVVDGASGHCKGAMVCLFHGWVYNLDGTLRGAARPESFGDMDRTQFGLKPVEMEIWHGFIFLRFHPGSQPSVADWLAPYEVDFAAYRAEELLPADAAIWDSELPVNWKSVRDVDNEGYHVPMAHPALQDLYGRSYVDRVHPGNLVSSYAEFGDQPGRLWSVKAYVGLAPEQDWLPERLRKAWTYYGLFPNAVIAFTPEGAQFYQDIPLSPGKTRLTGRMYRRADETREMRIARYLAYRIDRETSKEDQQLAIWSNESMKSTAFENFHLSDLEYGVRVYHDGFRRILPVTRLPDPPAEDQLANINENLLLTTHESQSN